MEYETKAKEYEKEYESLAKEYESQAKEYEKEYESLARECEATDM